MSSIVLYPPPFGYLLAVVEPVFGELRLYAADGSNVTVAAGLALRLQQSRLAAEAEVARLAAYDGSTCFECGADTDELTATAAGNRYCDDCTYALDLYTCDSCELLVTCTDETVDGSSVCPDCVIATSLYPCDDCARLTDSRRITVSGNEICDYCFRRNYYSCESCGDAIRDGDYCEDCDSSNDSDDDYDDDAYLLSNTCNCASCVRDRGGSYYNPPRRATNIQSYSYKPYPEFHGEGPLYLGLELELETGRGALADCADIANASLDTLGYLKEDCSLDSGFEIVTHPMSHDYALQHFPWGMLDELDSHGASADSTAGLHVHISREAFDGPAHIYRWLKLIYRNESNVTAIARRESGQWAPFKHSDRSAAKDYAKGDRYADRYAAVNVTNQATFEMRVFASSLNKQEVLAALDLAAASVEYTRTLTVAEIVSNGGWDWDAFSEWVNEYPEYAALAAEMGALCVS